MSAKITPGKWDLGDENNQCCSVLIGEKHNLTCWFSRQDENTGEFVIERDEMLANAHLLIDAGNVANKTGLTPRQLAVRITVLEAQSAELVEALKGVLDTRVAEVKAATAYRVAYDNFGNANREAGAHMRAMTAASNAEKKARAVIEKSTGSA